MRHGCVSRVLAGAGPVLLALGVASSASAVPLAFPADQSMVPVAVGAAFALPALLAGGYALVARIGRALGPVAGALVLAVMGAALAVYLNPGFMASLKL